MKIRELEEMLTSLPWVADQTVAWINSTGKNMVSSEIDKCLYNEVKEPFQKIVHQLYLLRTSLEDTGMNLLCV